jgi:DNA repair photolyase
LAHANGCLFAPQCDYCYLQSSFWYLDKQRVFTNVDRLFEDVRAWLRRDDLESYVLNAGNLSDSLTFEAVRPVMTDLVELFRNEGELAGRKHTLLLVTKGGLSHSAPLCSVAPSTSVVVSFSVNHPEAARLYERGASPAGDRFLAAEALKERGWRVRIRLDPMIAGFDYRETAARIRALQPERVTLGQLRAEPGLLRQVKHELFAGLGPPASVKSLARYPLQQRLALFRQVTDILGDCCPIGLCEETPEVWNAVFPNRCEAVCNCGL